MHILSFVRRILNNFFRLFRIKSHINLKYKKSRIHHFKWYANQSWHEEVIVSWTKQCKSINSCQNCLDIWIIFPSEWKFQHDKFMLKWKPKSHFSCQNSCQMKPSCQNLTTYQVEMDVKIHFNIICKFSRFDVFWHFIHLEIIFLLIFLLFLSNLL